MQFCYFAADIEGSGLSSRLPWVPINVLSVGLCVIGRPEANFYAELKPISEHWDSDAEKIHGLSRAYLREHGKDPREVLLAIGSWVREEALDATAVFCSLPISYDWVNLDGYYRRLSVDNPFLRTQDGQQLFRQIRGLERHEDMSRERIWAEFPTAIPHLHHALSDALEYEEVHGAMLRSAHLL